MKLKRDEFKAMLKECILELAQEGKIFQSNGSPQALNEVSKNEGSNQDSSPNSRLSEAVRMTAYQLSKGNPKTASMYESIVADTARTTLQKQLNSQVSGNGELVNEATLPEEKAYDSAQLGLFAANTRWAQLALGNKGKTSNKG